MRLWTIQPVEVVNILERDGVFTCDPEKSEYYNAFYDAYLWIAAEMDKRNIPHPDGIKLPCGPGIRETGNIRNRISERQDLELQEKVMPASNLKSTIKMFFCQIITAGITF